MIKEEKCTHGETHMAGYRMLVAHSLTLFDIGHLYKNNSNRPQELHATTLGQNISAGHVQDI